METTNEPPKSTNLVDPRAIVVITVGDVQQVAQQTINRELSGIELMQIQPILEAETGLMNTNRIETVQDAICKVLDVQRVPDTEQRLIRTLHDMSVRKAALIKFYERVMGRFNDDLLERLIFIQSFAALDASEGHGLAWMYTEDFNETLIRYQEAKEHED